jgi:hypothetical protein
MATLERLPVEEAQGRHADFDRTGRQFLLLEKVELVAAHLLRPQSVRRLTEVLRPDWFGPERPGSKRYEPRGLEFGGHCHTPPFVLAFLRSAA